MADDWFPFWLDTWDSHVGELPGAQFKVAVRLFGLASRRPTEGVWQGEVVTLPPGEFVTSVADVARGARVARSAVRPALAALERHGTIAVTRAARSLWIKLCKFDRRTVGRLPKSVPEGQMSVPEGQMGPNTSVPERQTSVPERQTSVPERQTSVPERQTSVPERQIAISDRARGDLRDLDLREREYARARDGEGSAPEGKSPQPPPTTAERDATLAQRAAALHQELVALVGDLRAELALPTGPRLSPAPGLHHLRNCGLLAAVEAYSDEDLRHVLDVRVAQARRDRSLEWLDGHKTWQPWALSWALPRRPADFARAPAPSLAARPGGISTASDEERAEIIRRAMAGKRLQGAL